MVRIVLVLLLASACSVSLVADDVAIICMEDADCPTGRCEVTLQRCFRSGGGTPLRFTSAVAVSSVRVDVVFNQALAPASVVDLAQVTIDPPLGLTGLALDESNQRLSITTEPQAFDVIYTLSVTGFVSSAGDTLDETARSQSFTSFLGLADRTPPAIIRPAEGSRVVGGDVDFAWQAIKNAASYTVELRRTDAPAPAIALEVPGSTTLTTITVPREGTYTWRVRADITTAEVYSTATFDVLVDAVYVSCPGGDCQPRIGNGSRRAPVQRINDALVVARQLGIGTVRIAARRDGGAYEEILLLGDTEIIIDGGFDASFAPGAGRAEIAAISTVVVAQAASGPLRIANVLLTARAGPSMEVVSVEGGVDISLDDVIIMAAPPVDTSVGINCDGRPAFADVHLSSVNMILAGPSSPGASDMVVGLRARDTRLDITDSFLEVGMDSAANAPQLAQGISLLGAGAIATTHLSVAVGRSTYLSVALNDQRTARLVDAPAYDLIEASRFWAPAGGVNIYGLSFMQTREVVIRNSVVLVGLSSSSEGVHLGGDLASGIPGPWFIHDLIQMTSDRPSSGFVSSAPGYVIAGTIITARACANPQCFGAKNSCVNTLSNQGPSTLIGTALACEVPYTGVGLGSPDFSQPNPSCVDNLGRQARCDGTTVVALPVDAYFADMAGADGNVASAQDNDYHLTAAAPASLRSGSVDLSSNVCGYADQSLPCYAGDRDADGNLRTAPFSMGPYDY